MKSVIETTLKSKNTGNDRPRGSREKPMKAGSRGTYRKTYESRDSWPRVSIITPSYNQDRFIEETIRSVLNQNYPNIEYVMIDGGSTDNSIDIIRQYEKDLAFWISEKDKGQSHAINKGWRRSTGEIVGYLNSDDTYEPNVFFHVVEFFKNHSEASMVYGNCNIIDEKSNIVDNNYLVNVPDFDLVDILTNNYIPQPTVFFRRRLLDEIGYLDESLHMAMDLDYWLRIGLKYEVRHIDKILANFRIHSSNKSDPDIDKTCPDLKRIYDKVFSRKDLALEVRRKKNATYSYLYDRMSGNSRNERKILRSKYYWLCSKLYEIRNHLI
ncbi:MAG TPA: glycosyltransferase [Cytophagales bacterium]|nr:glycosyltransferase [Cytophagales bacterium]|tara:strand:- start:511 stop:1485 length:975 start_codon:yes stop_codon:yes gene_type:complete